MASDMSSSVRPRSEADLWKVPPKPVREKMTGDAIDAKYSSREERIVTEMNREKLLNFVDALKRPNYMVLRPEYQRRRRWDDVRRSQLIESFIMNIPIPPLFIYETSYNRYEVMDGQQRIGAIQSFYENSLTLTGLERWPELNGYTYLKLPPKIKAGIDRRSISSVVLLTESAETEEDALLLKQLVFERLNTGGVRLSQQEVRNCLYQGDFNRLLIRLSRNPAFRKAWRLPLFSEQELSEPSEELRDNPFFAGMKDVEVVLRFFALRHYQHYQRGMQGFLDLYMIRAQDFDADALASLERLFENTVTLGAAIYGDLLFVPFDPDLGKWEKAPHVAFADAVMVGLSSFLSSAVALVAKSPAIIEATQQLFRENAEGTFAGRANTKKDVENRIQLFRSMLGRFAA